MKGICIILGVFGVFSFVSGLDIVTNGPAEPVYIWRRDTCASGRPLNNNTHPTPFQRDIPDVPPLAWRDPVQNQTFLVAAGSRGTWPNVGPDLNSVAHRCDLMIFNYSGPQGWNTNPSVYSSHEWLYSPWVNETSKTIHMLVHNEFHGWEQESAGLCNASVMVDGRCWYNSVTMSQSINGGLNFTHVAPPPQNLVGTSPFPYTANQSAYGLFSPSQMVLHPKDGYLYSFPRFRAFDEFHIGTDGIVVMRTLPENVGDVHSWRFWDGSSFSGIFIDPYTSKPPSFQPPVPLLFGTSTNGPSQPVPRYLPHLDLFLMSGYADLTNDSSHFTFSTAPNPWGPWSDLQPIRNVSINPTHDPRNPPGLYPAIFDPASSSSVFNTIESQNAYVYWVQGRDRQTVNASDMARDIWRQPILIQ